MIGAQHSACLLQRLDHAFRTCVKVSVEHCPADRTQILSSLFPERSGHDNLSERHAGCIRFARACGSRRCVLAVMFVAVQCRQRAGLPGQTHQSIYTGTDRPGQYTLNLFPSRCRVAALQLLQAWALLLHLSDISIMNFVMNDSASLH